MRIGIDAYSMAAPHGSKSLAGYTAEIIRGLRNEASDEVVALAPDWWKGERESVRELEERGVLVVSTNRPQVEDYFSTREHWEQHVLPSILCSLDIDVFLGPAFTTPLGWPGPKVVTVHDIAFERSRNFNSAASTDFYHRWTPRCAERASAVLVPSLATRSDMMRFWGIENNVVVTPLAPLLDFVSADRIASQRHIREALGISARYLLYVGSSFPRKNLERLIEAFRLVLHGCPDIRLVLTVNRIESLRRVVAEAGLVDKVVMIGFCPSKLLPHLYSAAEALVYPSLCEGFGLPSLEAMACSTPVAASKIPAHQEVLKNEALFFDPYNIYDMAATLRRILDNPPLRQRMILDGEKHARSYTWRTTARRTYEVLVSAANDSSERTVTHGPEAVRSSHRQVRTAHLRSWT